MTRDALSNKTQEYRDKVISKEVRNVLCAVMGFYSCYIHLSLKYFSKYDVMLGKFGESILENISAVVID